MVLLYSYLCGTTLESPDSLHRITTFQAADVPSQQPQNQWGMTIYIDQKLAVIQRTTNRWIITLTALTFLEGVFGLKAIAALVLDTFRDALRWLLKVIS